MRLREAELIVKTNEYQYRVRKTHEFIQQALERAPSPYVACSFGKDSSVMLHLTLVHSPDIPVRFATHPETNLLDDYERVVGWWVENHKINLEEVFCDGGFVKVKHHQRDRLSEGEYLSFFVGIRAEESKGRRISLKVHGQYHLLKNGKTKISPMAWWKEKEIAAYMLVNDLPMLDKYSFEGVSARTTSGIARTHLRETLTSLRSRDITRFNQLIKLFPDAAEFI